MKICHCITRLIVGGAQENTLLSAAGQAAAGNEVTVLTGPSEGSEGQLLQNSRFDNIKVVETPFLVRELSPVKDLKAYSALKQFFRDGGFDVVHTHSSKAGIIGRLAAHSAGVPVVVHTVHGQAFHPYEKRWKNKLYIAAEKWAAKYSDRIFAVAQAMIEQCVDAKIAPRDKYRVIYSGMDMAAFLQQQKDDELRERMLIPDGKFVIAVLARLFSQKGYEYVLPAAFELAKLGYDFHYLFIGDGPMKDDLQKQVNAHGLADKIHFAGLIAPSEVPRYLSLADILWHLSLHEGLPRSVVQALAMKKPAVGFALDGTPEVILDGQTGFLARAENMQDVLTATEKLAADAVLREKMGNAGQKLVKDRFEWHKMAQLLLDEYHELWNIKGKNPRLR